MSHFNAIHLSVMPTCGEYKSIKAAYVSAVIYSNIQTLNPAKLKALNGSIHFPQHHSFQCPLRATDNATICISCSDPLNTTHVTAHLSAQFAAFLSTQLRTK